MKGTELSEENLQAILYNVANGVKIYKILKEYSIGYDRLLKIINKNQNKIDSIRSSIAAQCEKEFLPVIIQKRKAILDSIDEKDVKTAKLASKTSAINDLTNVKRLESGQSTDNIAIISKDLDEKQLKEYILNGTIKDNIDKSI